MHPKATALAPDEPAVYFIQSSNGGPIKIGRVGRADALRNRLDALQTGSPYPLRVLRVIPGDLATEQELHLRFAQWRVSGEWFMPSRELAAYLKGSVAVKGEFNATHRLVEASYERGRKIGYDDGYRDGYLEASAALREAVLRLPVTAEDWIPHGSNTGTTELEAA
jgi:hypothetical protein